MVSNQHIYLSRRDLHAKLTNFMMHHARGRGLIVAIIVTILASCVLVTSVFAGGQDGASGPALAREAPPSSQTTSDKPSNPALLLPPSTLAQALALVRKGDYAAAIVKYQQLLQEKPKSPDAYAGLTRAYLKQHDVNQAYETVTRGLQVNDSWPIRVALGEVYFRQGKIPDAEKEWVTLINSGHIAARAYLGMARVRWAIGMNRTAKSMIDKAHELDPFDPDIKSTWIGTLPRAEAISYYEAFLAETQNSDAQERADVERYLSNLKEREKQHNNHCRLVSTVTHTQTPLVRLLLDPSHLRGYGLSVQLNGTHTNIMLDTGATGILVKRSTAERAGITKIEATKVWGIGDKGAKNAHVGVAKSIRIGELEFQDCPVEVMESRNVAGEDGLIGADVFEKFLVDIDFPNEVLRLSELPKRPGDVDERPSLASEEDDSEGAGEKQAAAEPDDETTSDPKGKNAQVSRGPKDRYIAPEMAGYSHVYRFGHDLLIPTKIGDVPGKLFLLDTGALTNAISPQAAREVTKVHGDADTTIKGISGSVKNVYSANKAVLQFGNLRQENQDMMSFDMTHISDSAGTEVSGFFGFVLLRMLDIKIDYRDSLVNFTYDRTRFGGR
jgi:predicted aspartyl protease